MIEVETPQEIEVVSNGIDVEARSLDVEVVDLKELDVTVAKKEFVITGDDIYIPKLYDDAPQWMKDLVQIVVNNAVETSNTGILNQLTSMLSQFATSYVPLNQYTQSILDLSNEDVSIHSVIETLNSSFNDGLSQANGQIITLQNTKASKDEVIAEVVSTLSAQLANPTSALGATIGNLQQTVVDNQNANALSMQVLTASIEGVSGDVVSNAEIVNNALAYVGIDEAGVSTGTGLSAYLEGSDGNFGSAGSQLNNDIKVTAEGIESKWAYNSTVNINGVYKKSGFGLTTNYTSGSGTEVDPYVSEFWIDASRLKFTNAAKTGSVAPFTIDASEVTPQIAFNGLVSFSNVTGYVPPDVSGDINANNNALAIAQGFSSYSDMASKYSALGKSIINGGYINTGLVSADSIAVKSISADRLMAGTSGSTVWSNGGLVSSNFNGNVSGNIGTPTSGFRLSSGAAGNTNDPNIYGAYIKGSTIEGITLNTSDIKVKAESYPNNFGRVNYVTNGGSIVMPAFGTGFYQNRVCSNSQSFVKLEGWHRGATNSLNAYLQYSVNGTVWYTLSSKNSQAYGYQEAFIIYFAELFPLGLVNVSDPVFFRIVGDGSYAYSSPVLVTIYNN